MKSSASDKQQQQQQQAAENINNSESIFIKQLKNIQRRHVQDLELRFTKQIFHEFDADGSNSIDIDELRLVMEAMGHEMTEPQLRELLEQVDINKSGDLSFSEFVQLIALWKAASQFKLFESDAPTIQDQRIQESLEPNLTLSDSWYRMAWDGVMYLVVIYSFFVISYILVTLNLEDDTISSVLIPNTMPADAAAACLWLIDMILVFFTAQRVTIDNPTDRRVLDTFKEVAYYHLTHVYFYIDLFALLPLHRIVMDGNLMWLGANTAFRIFKAPRLFQRSQRMQLTATYVYVHFYLVPLCHALVSALMFVHLLSCFWTLVQRAAQADGAPLFPSSPANTTIDSKSDNVDASVNYVASLYFILATLTTTGFGDIYILENNGRIVAACILCIVGTLTTGIVIGNIVSTLSKTNIHTDRENKLVQTLAVLNYFNVPGPLANEILNFQNHLLLHNLGDSHQGLIRGLPEEMQKNISLFSRINLVSECVLFRDAHQGTKVAIAEAIKPLVFRPDENVVVMGEVGDCMYFVSYGVLGMKMARSDIFFQRGNYFGEIALLCRGAKRTATIKALTYCDLFQLTRDIFRNILARFPKFRVAISAECQTRKEGLLKNFETEGDIEGYRKIQDLKFIHEEEEEKAAALLKQQQSITSQSSYFQNNNSTNNKSSPDFENQSSNNNTMSLNATSSGVLQNRRTSSLTSPEGSFPNTNSANNNNNQNQQQQQQPNADPASSSSATDNNTNNVHQNLAKPDTSMDLEVGGSGNNSNNNNNNNSNNNSSNRKREGSGGDETRSPCGERDTPENSVRMDIKNCSFLLTDLHAMVHSMTHGFPYSGPTDIPMVQAPPSSRSQNNSSPVSGAGSTSTGGNFNNQQQVRTASGQNLTMLSPNSRASLSVLGRSTNSSVNRSPVSDHQQ